MGSPRDALLVRLATVRRGRLLAVAHSAGAGADAEDAVQDVLARLSAGADLPEDEARAVAYAATAVRRRALDLRRAPAVEAGPEQAVAAEPAEEHERRRALRAFTQALQPLPERTRAVLVLDAAGWSRADVARHLGVTERVVKRLLDRHRAGIVAAAGDAIGGADCERFAGTLQAYAVPGRRLRPDGPLRAHLEVCDACRLALMRARALRALLPVPPSLAVAAAPAAPLAALKLGAAVVAAISVTGGAALLTQPTGAAHTIPPARATVVTPAPPTAAVVVPSTARVTTVRVATRPHRTPAPRRARPARRRATTPAPAQQATHRESGCGLGTLGISGLGC